GVDTDAYAPPSDRAAAFAEAKLPGRYAIGCFGRVRAQKGTDVFVEAMCRLLPRYPDFTAVIVGAVVPEQQDFAHGLKQQIAAPGDVEALVAALEPLMRDPVSAIAMGERARARVLQKFSLEAEANAIAAVYRSLG